MGLFDVFSGIGSAISSAFSNAANTIGSAISHATHTVGSAVSGVSRTVSHAVSSTARSISRTVSGISRPAPRQAAPTRKYIRHSRPSDISQPVRQIQEQVTNVFRPIIKPAEQITKTLTSVKPKTILDISKPVVNVFKPIIKPAEQITKTVTSFKPGSVAPSPELIKKMISESVKTVEPIIIKPAEQITKTVTDIKKIHLPEFKITEEKPFTIKNPIDIIVDTRNKAYEIGASEAAKGLQKGDIARLSIGGATFAGTAAADIALPLDLANVTNKVLTGRMNELSLDDYLWAGVDAATILAGLLSAGAGYVAGRGIKAALKGTKEVGELGKVAKIAGEAGKIAKIGETGKVAEVLEGGEKMGKLSGLFKGLESLKFEKGLPEFLHFKVPEIKPKVPIELEAHYGKFLEPRFKPKFHFKLELPHFKVPEFKPHIPELGHFKLPELPHFKPKFLEIPKLTKTEEAFKSTKGIESFEEAKVSRFIEPLKGEIKTEGELLKDAGKSAKLSREIEAASKGGGKLGGILGTGAKYAAVGLGGAALMYSAVQGRLQSSEEEKQQLINHVKQLEEKLKEYQDAYNNGQIPAYDYLNGYMDYLQQILDQLYSAYSNGYIGQDDYYNQLYDYLNSYLEEMNRAYEKGMMSIQDYLSYLEEYLNYLNQLYSNGQIDPSTYQDLYNQIMKELQDALNEYYSQYGEYPPGYEQYAENADAGYFEPAYGDWAKPFEYPAQDMTRVLDDIPIAGELFRQARKHGMAFPVIVATAGLCAAGGYYLFVKKKAAQKLVKKAKKVRL